MASALTSYIPPFDGFLPGWLLLVSIISIGNSIQSYTTLHFTARIYNANRDTSKPPSNITQYTSPNKPTPLKPGEIPSQVTPLSARTFGTWTFLAGIVRLYAAYNINVKPVYDLTLWTYGIAFAHFVGEWLVFGTARWNKGLAGPVVVSTVSLAWLFSQKEFYLAQ